MVWHAKESSPKSSGKTKVGTGEKVRKKKAKREPKRVLTANP